MDQQLNILLVGPNIEFLTDNTFAIVGGDSEPKLNGNKIDLLTVYHVRNGDQLDIGQITEGARGYIVLDTHLKLIKWLKAILHMLEVEWADLKVVH